MGLYVIGLETKKSKIKHVSALSSPKRQTALSCNENGIIPSKCINSFVFSEGICRSELHVLAFSDREWVGVLYGIFCRKVRIVWKNPYRCVVRWALSLLKASFMPFQPESLR